MEHRSSQVSGQPSALQEVSHGRGVHPWCRVGCASADRDGLSGDPRLYGAAGRWEHGTPAMWTMTHDRLALSDWRAEVGGPHVAMESTGDSWRPVATLLEGPVTIFLVHAAHVKQVPGWTTAKAAARWRANRMRAGLLQASFIPPPPQRDRRALTRDRTTWVQERRRPDPGHLSVRPVPTRGD